jgi:hypothetical protein
LSLGVAPGPFRNNEDKSRKPLALSPVVGDRAQKAVIANDQPETCRPASTAHALCFTKASAADFLACQK